MAKIVPLYGVRYNTEKSGNMSDLVTPPYDVIDDQQQQLYYAKSPYNVIRLELGKTNPCDDDEDNCYTRARGFLQYWLQADILRHETEPAIYYYEQEFSLAGKRLTRSGLIAGLCLEEYSTGQVLPHEETLSRAKEDRLQLLRHCRANFSPIFGLYEASGMKAAEIVAKYKKRKADVSFTDEQKETHRLWVIDSREDITRLQEFFQEKKVFIADGHHRYETALTFHKERLAQGDSRYGFCLATLVNLYDPGLVILPTHRLLKNVSNFDRSAFLAALSALFDLQAIPCGEEKPAVLLPRLLEENRKQAKSAHAYLLYLGDGHFYRLTIPRGKENKIIQSRYGTRSKEWRSLDVAVFQGLVLEETLDISSQDLAEGKYLLYTRGEAEALADVDENKVHAAFFLNPTRVEEVISVAAAGEKMPQKSTYFYPKLITGLVINDFRT